MSATVVPTLPAIAEALPRVDEEIRALVTSSTLSKVHVSTAAGKRLRSIIVLTGTLALGGTLDRRTVTSAASVEMRPELKTVALFRLACVLANHCAGADEEARMAEYGTAFGTLVQLVDDITHPTGRELDHCQELARRAAVAVPDRDNDAAAILRELPGAYLNWAGALIA